MKRKILVVFVIVVVAAIWIQSILPADISSQESGWFTEHIIQPIAEWLGLGSISKLIVRKLAHFSEYFILGLLATALWREKVVYSFQMSFLVAFLDESIQLLSKRGSRVLDIWIDIGGAAVGIGLYLLISVLVKKKRVNRE